MIIITRGDRLELPPFFFLFSNLPAVRRVIFRKQARPRFAAHTCYQEGITEKGGGGGDSKSETRHYIPLRHILDGCVTRNMHFSGCIDLVAGHKNRTARSRVKREATALNGTRRFREIGIVFISRSWKSLTEHIPDVSFGWMDENEPRT